MVVYVPSRGPKGDLGLCPLCAIMRQVPSGLWVGSASPGLLRLRYLYQATVSGTGTTAWLVGDVGCNRLKD
jgi:hypothetical protein